MPTIRQIREEEIPVLVDSLWRPFAEEMADVDSYDELADDIRDDALDFRREQFENDDVVTCLAVDEGTVTGYVAVGYQESARVFSRGPTGHVGELYVVPAARGTGIGSALLDRAEQWAAERNCEYVTLDVNVENTAAQQFYRSQNYSTRRHRMDKPLEEN